MSPSATIPATGPVRLVRPDEQRLPFVFASPHSGRAYPADLIAASPLPPPVLRRSEDAYVDELFAAVVEFGCPLISADFPRAFVDVNRGPSELDATLFDAPLNIPVDQPGPRVQAGLGVIPRVVRDGIEIYRCQLASAEAKRRLTQYYEPYHAALAQLVEQTKAQFGAAVVIDCHSMPSTPSVPEIVLGDCHGTSAGAALTRHIERAFVTQGFASARNAPYAGGFTTQLYARRDTGVQALQIEVNRGLYLDENRIEKTARFAGIRGRITAALRQILLTFDMTQIRPSRSEAAE